jgi:Trypsin-like peptidase domain
MRGVACIVLLGLLYVRPWPVLAANAVAAEQAIRSLVLVQGAESGTGFAVLSRGPTSYFITSAHLLDFDVYRANALLPDDDQGKKSLSDWLTVYDPVDGATYPAEIVGEPDFATDVMVFKVVGMAHHPRPLCLASALPYDPSFAIASFTVPVLQNPPAGQSFAQQRFVVWGQSTIPHLADSPEFQYATFQEQGFSGGPIFDTDTGAVIGMVRRAPLVRDPTTGNLVVSTNSRYGVTVDALLNYVGQLGKKDMALASIRVIVETDRSKLVPTLPPTGLLRLISFDQPLSDSSLSPVYAAYDAAIRRAIAARFGQPHASAVIDDPTAVFPIGKEIESISHLCRTSDGHMAAGVVALRREITASPGLRTLQSRVALVACNGHIIEARDLAPVQMNGGGPTDEQVQLFVRKLNDAFNAFAGANDERLSNFGVDGLPLSDSELRGFYQVSHKGAATLVSYSWAGGAAAQTSHVYQDTPVWSIESLSPADLLMLTPQSLDQALNRAGGALSGQLGGSSASDAQPMTLEAADRCFYLSLRKLNNGYDFMPKQYVKRNVL